MLNPIQSLESLAQEVLRLSDDLQVRDLVDTRVSEFLEVHGKDTYAWFEELTYCLLTAYSSARLGQLCVDALCDCDALLGGTVEKIEATLRGQGHRFAARRAEYIHMALRLAPDLKGIIAGFEDSSEARRWLVINVKGLGWKESSHFLRNVGYMDLAILDRHILANMREYGIIADDGKKGLTRKRYLEYERILMKLAERVEMSLGELDLYMWYMKTGKVLK